MTFNSVVSQLNLGGFFLTVLILHYILAHHKFTQLYSVFLPTYYNFKNLLFIMLIHIYDFMLSQSFKFNNSL